MSATLNWKGRLRTADGRTATLLPPDQAFAGRRVQIGSGTAYTIWHYNEDGTLDASGPEWKLENVR